MKICPKWKINSAAELAAKNLYAQQEKTNNYQLTESRYLGVRFSTTGTLENTLGDTSGDTLGTQRASASSWAS